MRRKRRRLQRQRKKLRLAVAFCEQARAVVRDLTDDVRAAIKTIEASNASGAP